MDSTNPYSSQAFNAPRLAGDNALLKQRADDHAANVRRWFAPRVPFVLSEKDRMFLKTLRIAADA